MIQNNKRKEMWTMKQSLLDGKILLLNFVDQNCDCKEGLFFALDASSLRWMTYRNDENSREDTLEESGRPMFLENVSIINF
jgi:hypothetical protein